MNKSQHPQPSRRLVIFQETRNPHNTAEIIYLPVNKLGLPICGDGPELPSILELPLHILKVFTDIFNQPKYKGWYVFTYKCFLSFLVTDLGGRVQCICCEANLMFTVLGGDRAVLSAGRYHDTSEEGKFYAVVLEQTFVPGQGQVQGQGTMDLGTATP